MLNKDKIGESEVVRIPLKSTAFTEFTAGVAKWTKENKEKSTWAVIDLKTVTNEGNHEILVILAGPKQEVKNAK
jgi:hypothetical protein